VDAKGDYVTSDTRVPNDEVEEGKGHKDTDKIVSLIVVFYLLIWNTRQIQNYSSKREHAFACVWRHDF
jgi:hypothetical protein